MKHMSKVLWTTAFVLSLVFALLAARPVFAAEPSESLIQALILVESGGDDHVVGDRHLNDMAYGCLQIRQPCVDDYNRWHNTNFKAKDCLGDRALSIKICKSYIDHYAKSSRIGRTPTDEDKARIWNGGPNGYRKESTVRYWNKVLTKLQ